MVFDNPELAGLADLAARALQHQIRQVVSSTTSNASPDPTASPSLTSSLALTPTAPTSEPTPTSTSDGSGSSGGGGGGSSGSSPLLFFVALGFGVVFTNLWIIVGVKYCFRYNARNRNIRMTGEDGEPINLENMPQHPRRRRREKKLMTIDEVNEKFPMMKYKSWVASRAQEGLPTRGGISQPPSRAGSLRDADGIIPVTKERESTDERPRSAGASLTRSPTHDDPSTEHAEKTAASQDVNRQPHAADGAAAANTAAPDRTASPDSDEDEHYDSDQIHDALPPEALETSGDTCAICIDTLEDDDDVRGLACGHAFHAVCLDPWLTSRRACCPLCKADYYTPKPRPPQPDGAHGGIEMGPPVSIAQDTRTGNMPHRPGVVWVFHPRRGRFALPSFRNGHNASSNNNNNNRMPASPRTPGALRRQEHQSFLSRMTGPTRTSRSTPATNSTEARGNQSGGLLANLRMPRFNLPGRSGQSTATPEVTPSNLEAGTRTEGAR